MVPTSETLRAHTVAQIPSKQDDCSCASLQLMILIVKEQTVLTLEETPGLGCHSTERQLASKIPVRDEKCNACQEQGQN